MGRIYLPSDGPESWRALLADPARHWREGYSAHALANCWEAAIGLPPEIEELFKQISNGVDLLIALPEHKVALPGGGRESQTDLFALVRAGALTVSTAVEGKVEESFGPKLSEWLVDASEGKLKRLGYIRDLLGLSSAIPGDIRYQLLHRTASALIEAQRFKTDASAMVVHSFSSVDSWFNEFERFVALFNEKPRIGRMVTIALPNGMPLYLGWAKGTCPLVFQSRW